MKKVKFIIILLLGIELTVHAQGAFTNGGNAYGNGGRISYSVGQMSYTRVNGINNYLLQGVQQPYEISIVNQINEITDILLQCDVYPNPTNDILKLKIANPDKLKLSYCLYDGKGNLVLTKEIENNETYLSFKNYSPAVYFLKINNNNTIVKTIKILKK